MIEGLSAIEGPHQQVDQISGPLVLPSYFDTKKYIAKWVKDGPMVEKAKEPTRHYSAGVIADGWQVFIGPEKKPVKRALGSGAYVLMFRPRKLQETINKIHANESRSRMHSELNHNSVTLEQSSGGMISEEALKAAKQYENDGESPNLPLHPIDVARETTIQTQDPQ